MKSHAETYKGLGFAAFVHRTRLRTILNILEQLKLSTIQGSWADFGCSDGFIFQHVSASILFHWKLYGFDHAQQLLKAARERNIANAQFDYFQLNNICNTYCEHFELVTCFEAIEHTGNYRNAFENLYISTKPGGHLIISVPNEVGFIGIMKILGRKFIRRNAYLSFFEQNRGTEMDYISCLIRGKDIEMFRRNPNGYGAHLGFNYKNFELYIQTQYMNKGVLLLLKTERPFIGFNRIYIFHKPIRNAPLRKNDIHREKN